MKQDGVESAHRRLHRLLLHEALTTRPDDHARQSLQQVLDRYFRQDIESLFTGDPT